MLEPRSDNATADTIYQLTHTSLGGYILTGVGSFVHLINLVVILYVIYHRNYFPIKIKQVPVLALGMFGGFTWWISALSVVRILAQANNPAFLQCTFWAIWGQIVFGLMLFETCLVFRLARLYVIVRMKKDISGWRGVVLFLALWAPIIIFGIGASPFQVDGPSVDAYGLKVCFFIPSAMYTMVGIIFAQMIISFILMCLVRKVRARYLLEYQESVYSILVFALSFIIYLVIIIANWQKYIAGEAIMAFIVVFIPTFFLYLSIGKPVYKCLTDHDAYQALMIATVRNHSGQLQESSRFVSQKATSPAKVSEKGSERGSEKEPEGTETLEMEPPMSQSAADLREV